MTAIGAHEGQYLTLAPARLLDTRNGTGAPKAPVQQGGTVGLAVTGHGGVPASGVSAVTLNLTAVGTTASGYFTAYPKGVTRPVVSSINFAKGWTRANAITVPVGAGGVVNIYNYGGAVNIVADVTGYYLTSTSASTGSNYQEIVPYRKFDSRVDLSAPVGPGDGYYMVFDFVDGDGNPINDHIRAMALNITAVSPTASGYLLAWDGSDPPPATSNLNFTKGATVPNTANVPTMPCPAACGSGAGLPSLVVANGSSGTVHFIVDVVGFYDDATLPDGRRFKARTPIRIVDTRTGLGTTSFGAGVTKAMTAPPTVAGLDTTSLVANTTAVAPTASTYLTVWPHGLSRPGTSSVNAAAGQIIANGTIIGLGAGNVYDIFNRSGTTNVLVDVSGTFEVYPSTTVAPGLRPGANSPRRVTSYGPSAARSTTSARPWAPHPSFSLFR